MAALHTGEYMPATLALIPLAFLVNDGITFAVYCAGGIGLCVFMWWIYK